MVFCLHFDCFNYPQDSQVDTVAVRQNNFPYHNSSVRLKIKQNQLVLWF